MRNPKSVDQLDKLFRNLKNQKYFSIAQKRKYQIERPKLVRQN